MPQLHEQERDERRGGDVPVEEDFDVVPEVRRQLRHVRRDEAERERQIEAQRARGHEARPQERRREQRDEQPRVLQPEPDDGNLQQ